MIKCMMFADESIGIIEEDIDNFLELHDDIEIVNAHTVITPAVYLDRLRYTTIIFYEEKK